MFDATCSYRSTTFQTPSNASPRGVQLNCDQKATVSIRGLTIKAMTTVPSYGSSSLELPQVLPTSFLAPAYSSVVIAPPLHSPLLDRASSMFSENTYKITVK